MRISELIGKWDNRIMIIESSLSLALSITNDILSELTEVTVALLSDWILHFNSIMCTEAEFCQVCALQLRQLLTALLIDAIPYFN